MPSSNVDNTTSQPGRQEVREELDRILSSEAFRRAERHGRFLSFVCETALNGNGAQLNEYLIAHEVFGRGSEYSPGEDSVVRRQAHAVRQKLQDYYAGPGKDDVIRIGLPVGRYVPTFTRVDAEAEAEAIPAAESMPATYAIPVSSPARWRPAAWIAGALALLALGWMGGASRARTTPGLDPALEELWSAWLHDPAGATLCYSNPLTAVVKQFSAPVADNTIPPRLMMRPEEAEYFRKWLQMPAGGFLYLSPAISQAKMGEAIGSVRLAALFAGQRVPVQTTQSRFLSWDDFRTANLVLMGNDEANRWLDPILAKLPMRLAATDGEKPRRILDLQAKPGEQAEYRIEYSRKVNQPSQDYALISMLNGLDGKRQLLLVNGLNTEGTETALEYLSDPAGARTLLAALHRAAPGHRGAWVFQAVVRAEVRDKVPTRADLIVVRVL